MMPLVVWRLSDGKAGHDSQSHGLINALAALRPVNCVTLAPLPWPTALSTLLCRRWPEAGALPAPDLLIGAGHRTHLSLLAARCACGGRIIVLMRPSLPLRLFDLCLIPEHDAPPIRPNVLATRGALNRILPSATLNPDQGLILIGGPSAHFGWNDANVCRQIAAITTADPAIHWTLTTSRRTPSSFLEALAGVSSPKLTVVPVAQTGPDWLPAQLARAGQAWVSADSVSMVYEALSAGAAVGVLAAPQQHVSRISRGLDRLADDGWVTLFTDWQRNRQLRRPAQPFNEAERCARRIVERWFA
ncbi:MAG TPA: mitochondrial fission ELM1 family protein [Candidatus Contendobacter sp.]|nr:mitochondrial fission ELM1 family protein [Candidatus Contendobacter sp.]HRD50125.1 mitochondrial fission ELM1 family protein [Candidatus Contendobacter sp.]